MANTRFIMHVFYKRLNFRKIYKLKCAIIINLTAQHYITHKKYQQTYSLLVFLITYSTILLLSLISYSPTSLP